MRRIVVGLAVFAALTAAATASFLVIAASLAAQAPQFQGAEQPSEDEIARAESISRTVSTLLLASGPLLTAALTAVTAILALLAFRWELRRAVR